MPDMPQCVIISEDIKMLSCELLDIEDTNFDNDSNMSDTNSNMSDDELVDTDPSMPDTESSMSDTDSNISEDDRADTPPAYMEVDTDHKMTTPEPENAAPAYNEVDTGHEMTIDPEIAAPAYVETEADYEMSDAEADYATSALIDHEMSDADSEFTRTTLDFKHPLIFTEEKKMDTGLVAKVAVEWLDLFEALPSIWNNGGICWMEQIRVFVGWSLDGWVVSFVYDKIPEFVVDNRWTWM